MRALFRKTMKPMGIDMCDGTDSVAKYEDTDEVEHETLGVRGEEFKDDLFQDNRPQSDYHKINESGKG